MQAFLLHWLCFFYSETFGLLRIALIEAMKSAFLTWILPPRICCLNLILLLLWAIGARFINFAIHRLYNIPSYGNKAIKIAAVYSPIPFSDTSISLLWLAYNISDFGFYFLFPLAKIDMWLNTLNVFLFRFFL